VIISHQKKFIFIHIYKNAGTSITSIFLQHTSLIHHVVNKRPYNYIVSLINRIFRLSNKGNKWLIGFRKHALALEIRSKIGQEVWDDFYKFAFARNPYSHVESLYLYIRQNSSHKYFLLANKKSFNDFVSFYCSSAFILQNEFVCDGKKMIVDFVGNVEEMQSGLEKIHQEIGIDFQQDCPIMNRSTGAGKESLWIGVSRESLIQFNNYAKVDFQMFGYKIYNSCQEVCKKSRNPRKIKG
jgi:hypothetical protein